MPLRSGFFFFHLCEWRKSLDSARDKSNVLLMRVVGRFAISLVTSLLFENPWFSTLALLETLYFSINRKVLEKNMQSLTFVRDAQNWKSLAYSRAILAPSCSISTTSYQKRKIASKEPVIFRLVRVVGIEPTTSFLSGMRSTTELHARKFCLRDSSSNRRIQRPPWAGIF